MQDANLYLGPKNARGILLLQLKTTIPATQDLAIKLQRKFF